MVLKLLLLDICRILLVVYQIVFSRYNILIELGTLWWKDEMLWTFDRHTVY